MVREEYEKLIKLLEGDIEKVIQIGTQALMDESKRFLDEIAATFPTAPKEEQKEMVEMVKNLEVRLSEISGKIAEKAGVTEEELEAAAENPSLYSPEDWDTLQKGKKALYGSAQKLSDAVTPEVKPLEGEELPKRKILRPAVKRARRTSWKKS